MKILGIVLACFIGVVGVSVGIFALRGGFGENKVDIVDLYLNKAEDSENTTYELNTSQTKLTIYTLTDIKTSISFAPLDATEKDLTVRVTGVDGVLANKEELVSGIVAGDEFDIKIRKDAMGNNHGGVVNLTFESSNGLARVSIVVVVDVPIPSNTIYFSGDNNNRITSTGKAFTLSKNTNKSYVYLKSELYNVFSLKVSGENLSTATGNLKSTEISYKYTPLDGTDIITHTYTADELEIVKGTDSLTHTSSYYYKIPIIPTKSGTIVFTAKTHRSYGIQQEFEHEFVSVDNMEKIFHDAEISGALQQNIAKAKNLLTNFSAFVDKYISYFDDTEESKYFFMNNVDDNGKISFKSYDSARKALSRYVFVSCTADVDVTAVNLDKITSKTEADTPFYVFDNSAYFSTSEFKVDNSETSTINIIDEFDLKISLKGQNGESVSGDNDENATLFDTLEMGVYIYLPNAEDGSDLGISMGWTKTSDAYDELIPVYGFENEDNKPITPYIVETYSAEEREDYVDPIGYLYKLKTSMTSNRYMDINSFKKNEKTYWKVDFNVPLRKEFATNKSLYFRFAVNGVDLGNKMTRIDRETFTRVYIDFTGYEFADNVGTLTLKSSETEYLNKSMALNTELANANGYAQSKQNVIVDTSSNTILNFNGSYVDTSSGVTKKEVEYKSIMYFVESESNTLDGNAKQVATLGKYNFVDVTTGSTISNGDKLLEGERIATCNNTRDVKQFYIQTLNTSPLTEGGVTIPVKLFAVVYLSDKYGNPIDLEGKKIEVADELEPEEATIIYVVAMSDVSANDIYIDNFVDTVNFYTVMASTINLCQGLEDLQGGITYDKNTWVKRNVTESFTYSDNGFDIPLTGEFLKEYKDFLQLKLLKGKEFKLYLTNFELASDGTVLDTVSEKRIRVEDINGKEYAERAFIVNTKDNKQKAFNNLTQDFTNKFRLSVPTGVTVDDSQFGVDDNNSYLKFVIIASGEDTSGTLSLRPQMNSIIYSTASTSHIASLTVNHLEINDMEITEPDYKLYNSLNASYISNIEGISDENRGKVEFKTVSNGTSTPYTPKSANSIAYTVSTNLGKMVDGFFEIDTKIVDPSQAVYDEDIEGESNIKAYIDSYTQTTAGGIGNIKKNYSLVTKFAVLTNELTIQKEEYDGKFVWVIGDTIFENSVKSEENENGNISYLEINGVKYYDNTYPVVGNFADGSAKFVFPTNTYFPIVTRNVKDEDGQIAQEQVMYMLGEEFVVEKITGELNEYKVFYLKNVNGDKNTPININVVEMINIEAKDDGGNINKQTFRSSDYISILNSGDSFELQMGEDTTYQYYEDESGEYRYDSNTMTFIKADADFDGIKYRRQAQSGVMVYLFVSFGFTTVDVTMNKVLTFNLKQPNLNFEFLLDETTENSIENPLDVNAGQSTTIYLNANGKYPAINSSDPNVFKHIELEGGITGVTLAKNENSSEIVITAGNFFGSDSPQSFKIKYKFKNKVLEKECYINIKPNYNFVYSEDTDDTYYKLSLDAYGIDTLNNKYAFTTNDDTKVKSYNLSSIFESLYREGSFGFDKCKLTLLTGESNYHSVTFADGGSTLNAGISTIKKTSNNEYLVFSITLTVNGKSEVLAKKLRVEIVPTYKVEISDTLKTDSDDASIETIFNGTDIFDYVNIYSYDSSTKDYSKATGLNSLVSITATNCTDATKTITINNGIINVYTGDISKVDTLVKLTFAYGGVTEYRYIKVFGISMFYSESGAIDSDITLSECVDSENIVDMSTIDSTNISLELSSETSAIDLTSYFVFFASDGTKLNVKLVDTSDNSNVFSNTLTSTGFGKTYGIYFELIENGVAKYTTNTNITITITLMASEPTP